MTDTVSFYIADKNAPALIDKIAARARQMDLEANGRNAGSKQHHRMNITACVANGNPLRLADLLAADDFNFAHDVFGINRHICRDTGKLLNCFSPRYSQRNPQPA